MCEMLNSHGKVITTQIKCMANYFSLVLRYKMSDAHKKKGAGEIKIKKKKKNSVLHLLLANKIFYSDYIS